MNIHKFTNVSQFKKQNLHKLENHTRKKEKGVGINNTETNSDYLF